MSSRTRSYRSTLRTEQAAETRRRILDSAATCFSTGGYAGTSLTRIAKQAGVSTETVKANGPKRALLLGAFEQTFAGHEGSQSIADGDDAAQIAATTDDDEYLSLVAAFVASANARTSVLWSEFLSAATADNEVASSLDGLLSRRREDYRALAATLLDRGMVTAGRDITRLADELSFLWSPESHQQLVLQSGWPMDAYTSWLAEVARRQFR